MIVKILKHFIDKYKITLRIKCLIVVMFCCGLILSCNKQSNKASKLPYFVPEVDDSGEVKRSKKGDTIWHKIPSFSFVDENGNEITEGFMEGNIVVVDFFFTTCPSICIPMSHNLSKIQEHFVGNEDVKLLSHTVDPKKDTPEILKAYAELYDADPKTWKFATGGKKALYKQARDGYFITAIEGDGGETDFIHSDKFVLIDKNKNIRGFFRGTVQEDMDSLISSMEILLKEN